MNTAVKAVPGPVRRDVESAVKPHYLEALHLVERLHRRLLDVIKDEFERRGRDDVNSVQALLLYNIGDKELTASELRTRGYYLGSNVSYNVKKLVEMGYLHHARSRVDRRSVRISLTEKGKEVHEIVKGLYDKHSQTIHPIGGISDDDFQRLNQALTRLERFWTDQIRYRL
jgi:DNA-binding MarR family transcriptional regulator